MILRQKFGNAPKRHLPSLSLALSCSCRTTPMCLHTEKAPISRFQSLASGRYQVDLVYGGIDSAPRKRASREEHNAWVSDSSRWSVRSDTQTTLYRHSLPVLGLYGLSGSWTGLIDGISPYGLFSPHGIAAPGIYARTLRDARDTSASVAFQIHVFPSAMTAARAMPSGDSIPKGK